jgi:aminoglycoside 3-N-acetyltransferase
MITFREFVNAFRELGLDRSQPVIVHASLSSVGEIRGGAETVLGALLTLTNSLIAPVFTYKTMITPETGPENNAFSYGTGKDRNSLAEFFHPDMPADPGMGILAETIRKHPNARRSGHPILSFAGIQVDEALSAQTIEDPLAPFGVLASQHGTVLLIGVDHTVNTSIHYAEKLAGRKQFVRWALTPQGVRECPGMSGCSDSFNQASALLEPITRSTHLGDASLQALPLAQMLDILVENIKKQPALLLCENADERCAEVRRSIQLQATEGSGELQTGL